MGMETFSHGNTQDEIARIFQLRVKAGEFVQVGVDRSGSPLYMEAQTVRGWRPFAWLDAAASRILNVFVRKGGLS